jgi:hypothetical protein
MDRSDYKHTDDSRREFNYCLAIPVCVSRTATNTRLLMKRSILMIPPINVFNFRLRNSKSTLTRNCFVDGPSLVARKS